MSEEKHDELNFLRGKLYPRVDTDEYTRQVVRQNLGAACEHCDTLLGHRNYCPLLNRQAAETASREPQGDVITRNLGKPCGYCGVLLGHDERCVSFIPATGLLHLTTDDFRFLAELKVSL